MFGCEPTVCSACTSRTSSSCWRGASRVASMNLSATSVCSWLSCASFTLPLAPLPNVRLSSYRPSNTYREPGSDNTAQ